jgi:hypothetical protein
MDLRGRNSLSIDIERRTRQRQNRLRIGSSRNPFGRKFVELEVSGDRLKQLA